MIICIFHVRKGILRVVGETHIQAPGVPEWPSPVANLVQEERSQWLHWPGNVRELLFTPVGASDWYPTSTRVPSSPFSA